MKNKEKKKGKDQKNRRISRNPKNKLEVSHDNHLDLRLQFPQEKIRNKIYN
jgi:hypothetical protein